MKTSESDLSLINDHVVPLIIGKKRFAPLSESQVNMGYNEMACFYSILSNIRPKCAIEIGTESGSTFALLSEFAERAISIDIDPGVKTRLEPIFENGEFLTGSSHDLLPDLLKNLSVENAPVEFIFVDGNHMEEFVRRDIENILSYRPISRLIVLMHDTFNPGCRKGILSADWARNPNCHFVDLDFSPGILHPDPAIHREMRGGLGLALFLPEERKSELNVKTSHQTLYEAAFRGSVYAETDPPPCGNRIQNLLSRILGKG